jgi:hypothetical protein
LVEGGKNTCSEENAMRIAHLLGTAALLASCTSVHYESPRLGEGDPGGETVAVLPFEMVLAGNQPEELSSEEITTIEEVESLVFQSSLYGFLMDRSSASRKRPIQARIQPIEVTNRLLREADVSVRDSWTLSSETLARILGVDGLIRTRVEKTRYLSDLASWGAEVGLEVAREVTGSEGEWLIPPGLTRTDDIFADSELVSALDGELLWKVVIKRSTDWRRPANDVVAGITRKLSKRFPYRG